jgi:hypothetical protein
VPTASSVNRGALSAADWTTFNSKAPGVTFTSGYIPFGQGTTTLNQSANLTFDGTTLATIGLTTTGNTILGDASTDTLNVGAGGLVKDASGNVIVGSTTAFGKLSVVGNASTVCALANLPALGNFTFTPALTFQDSTNVYGQIQSYRTGSGTGDLIFSTRTAGTVTEKTRIFASGGVSIGNTTDPGATNLSVTGAIAGGSTITATTKVIGTTGVYSTKTTYSAASGATVTVLNMANTKMNGIITVFDAGGTRIGSSGQFANYWDNGANNAPVLWSVQNSGFSGSALTLTGNTVQFTHTFGSTRTLTIAILYYT